MRFKEGKVVRDFEHEIDGKKINVIFRFPKKSDLKDVLRFVNKCRKETEYLAMTKKETLKSERKWLYETIEGNKKGEKVMLVAEVEGKIIGNSTVEQSNKDRKKHTGSFGIMFLQKYTGYGLGPMLAKEVFKLVKKNTEMWLIESEHHEKNKPSAGLHKKLGFRKVGIFPKYIQNNNGSYSGRVVLYKLLK